MADVVLATLNAKYIHASLGLRYLLANLGDLRAQAELCEFTIHERPGDVVERLLQKRPKLVGLGVYIWNTVETLHVVEMLKRVAPEVLVVLGGPEVRFEQSEQRLCQLADYVVVGEGDVAMRELAQAVLAGHAPPRGLVKPPLPNVETLVLPYGEYSDDDLAHRVVYVEASRGCPYRCEFCLSSLDEKVRRFPLERFLSALDGLVQRGARHFKFVDRTFNLDLKLARAILDFFLARVDFGVTAHFEMVPDRLPEELRDIIACFPAGALQFEIGIQTWDAEVGTRISRRQDSAKTEANLTFLRQETQVHLHTDLIVGLPGEDVSTFARGFDRLFALSPHEIQVGILKRLRGAPITRHDAEWGMVYSPVPPYEVLRTGALSFEEIQALKRFARAVDLVWNSGKYPRLAGLLVAQSASAFDALFRFSQWLHGEVGPFVGLAPERLSRLLCGYVAGGGVSEAEALRAAESDAAHRARSAAVMREQGRALQRQTAHG